MLQSFEPDECCGDDLADALLSGELDTAETWTHEGCGQQWRPIEFEGVRHWHPHESIEVIR